MIHHRVRATFTRNNTPYIVLFIGCTGLLIRIICIVTCEYGSYSDAHEFLELALNLLSGRGFAIDNLSTAYRMPGYPLVLALLFAILKNDIFVKIAQGIIELGTGYIIFLITKKTSGYRPALTAFTIWTLLPVSILQPLTFMSEGIFTFIFILLLYCMTFRISLRTTILGGILCGIATLIKPHMLLFPAVFFIITLLHRIEPRRAVIYTILYGSLIMVILAPWVIRNKHSMGSYLLNTNGGQNLYLGNNPDATGSFYDIPRNKYPSISDEVLTDRYFKTEAITFVKSHPFKAAMLIPRKIAYFFSLESMYALFLHNKGHIPKGISYTEAYRTTPIWLLVWVNIPYVLLVIASVMVFFHVTHRVPILRIILCIISFWIIIHCIYFGSPRFHYPLLPLFTIAASQLGMVHIKKKNRCITVGAISVSLLFCVVWTGEILLVFLR